LALVSRRDERSQQFPSDARTSLASAPASLFPTQQILELVNADGEVQAKYFQRKAKLRKGERINLFHAMKHLTLDQLAVAGGEGCKLLANAKRIALSTKEEN
jgi:hypothetical protein